MAIYTANIVTYSPGGAQLSNADGADFNSNNNTDGTWDTGDSLTNVGPNSTFLFQGTVTDGGVEYLQFTDGTVVKLLTTDIPSASFPATYQDGDLGPVDPASAPTCFLPGTEIATPDGVALVEDLKIGDPVLNMDGDVVPVKWIGRQTVSTRFGAAERLMPVRFAAGSLGNGLPHSDLTVTADHAMLIDGVLCNASALVNDATITRVPLSEMGDRYTVYHIETQAHDIVLANGAAAETFIDNVSRRVFDNYAEYDALYGDTPEMTELPYPRAMSARQVPARLRAKLASQKAA
ncbi:Hint domain-containing protein [Falsiphaeobacter marinintestinus]|uniref:Hint domain-containing protein n=1 Tax=Falsiphaeobacter marinintestinus TaxID=1492905 RepID=UPI0011B6C499|nr:Hint domain-containing protein [Phaeobacter marinintestinus]